MGEPREPFHPGEQALQARAGVRQRAEQMGRRMIREELPLQHRELYARLPLLIAGTLDAAGRPWASALVGPPGFIRAPDPHTLEIAALPAAGDPAATQLEPGAPVALLGIQLETRRRNRANGRVARRSAGGFAVHVQQAFGNCPQYIQARAPAPHPRALGAVKLEGALLSAGAAALIAGADTFFIASASPHARAAPPPEGVDVSHRGGPPGFVRARVEDGGTLLSWPDYSGNNAFNTLGNLELHPYAGLLFLDFAAGAVLSLVGRARILWDGALRWIELAVERGVHIDGALPLRWSAVERSAEAEMLEEE